MQYLQSLTLLRSISLMTIYSHKDKICPVCNKSFPFSSRHPDVICCSYSCSAKRRHKNTPKVSCINCHKEFSTIHFSSHKCQKLNCIYCDKKFIVQKMKYRQFCSTLCNMRYQGIQRKKKRKSHSKTRRDYDFKFNVFHYPDLFDLNLLKEIGFYNSKTNLSGLTRDHKVSAAEAVENNYDPFYITHPLNCQLMNIKDNAKKGKSSSITYEQLVVIVNNYDEITTNYYSV